MINFNHRKLAFKVIYLWHTSDDFNEVVFQKKVIYLFFLIVNFFHIIQVQNFQHYLSIHVSHSFDINIFYSYLMYNILVKVIKNNCNVYLYTNIFQLELSMTFNVQIFLQIFSFIFPILLHLQGFLLNVYAMVHEFVHRNVMFLSNLFSLRFVNSLHRIYQFLSQKL